MLYCSSGWMLALVFEVMHWISLRLTCLGGVSTCRFMAFWHRRFIWNLACLRVPCWDQFCFFFTLQILLHWCRALVFQRMSLPMTCRCIVTFLMLGGRGLNMNQVPDRSIFFTPNFCVSYQPGVRLRRCQANRDTRMNLPWLKTTVHTIHNLW